MTGVSWMIWYKGLMVVSPSGMWMKDTACTGKDFFGTAVGIGKDIGPGSNWRMGKRKRRMN